MCSAGENKQSLAGTCTASYVGVVKSRADRLGLERRSQSRASPTSQRRRGVPCKRLIRDSAGLAALALVNQTAREPFGDRSRSSQGYTATLQLGGRHGKKNGEVNSPTPGNQCAGRPELPQGVRAALFPVPVASAWAGQVGVDQAMGRGREV